MKNLGIHPESLLPYIPRNLLSLLQKEYIVDTLKMKNKMKSKIDKTIKYLFETHDKHHIESVSIIDKNRHTICLSSQIDHQIHRRDFSEADLSSKID